LLLDFIYRQTAGITEFAVFLSERIEFKIVKHRNEHFGFSLNRGLTYWQILLVQLGAVLLCFAFLNNTALLLAGVTNLLDRFYNRAVIDYLYLRVKNRVIIFNIADLIINLSLGGIIYEQMTAGHLLLR
jgi:lipoprotein signal peptidase